MLGSIVLGFLELGNGRMFKIFSGVELEFPIPAFGNQWVVPNDEVVWALSCIPAMVYTQT